MSDAAPRRNRLKGMFLFLRVVDLHVLAITVLAVLATWLSIEAGIRARLPSEIIAVAIVFPIVFSINASYRRREEALRQLAAIRAALGSIYLAHRDLPTDPAAHAERARRLGRALYRAVCEVACVRGACRPEALSEATGLVSDLSRSIAELRTAGLAPPDVARLNGLLGSVVGAFETLRAILEYRTPASLRAHSKLFLNLFPVLYAPLYADIAAEAGIGFGYAVAVAFAVVLVGLDNIQDGLEHPFDALGSDDVRVNAETDLIWLPPDAR